MCQMIIFLMLFIYELSLKESCYVCLFLILCAVVFNVEVGALRLMTSSGPLHRIQFSQRVFCWTQLLFLSFFLFVFSFLPYQKKSIRLLYCNYMVYIQQLYIVASILFNFFLVDLGDNLLAMGSSSDSTSSKSMRLPGAGSGALGAGVSSEA